MEMCVPYDGCPQAESSSVSCQGDSSKDLAWKVPFPISDTSWQPCSRYLYKTKVHSSELLLGSVPPAGVCRDPLWYGQCSLPPPMEQDQAHKQLSCSANALQHPDLPSVNHSLDFSLWVLSKTADIWYLYASSQSFCFSSPQWACQSEGVDIATLKWRKVLKLFHARCAAVNLGWQEAHSGQFLCPVQQAMTFSDCKHDPTHLKDNFSHRLNCINLLS